jgi:hypothetical protein
MGYYEMQVCWNLLFSILNCIKIRANRIEQCFIYHKFCEKLIIYNFHILLLE